MFLEATLEKMYEWIGYSEVDSKISFNITPKTLPIIEPTEKEIKQGAIVFADGFKWVPSIESTIVDTLSRFEQVINPYDKTDLPDYLTFHKSLSDLIFGSRLLEFGLENAYSRGNGYDEDLPILIEMAIAKNGLIISIENTKNDWDYSNKLVTARNALSKLQAPGRDIRDNDVIDKYSDDAAQALKEAGYTFQNFGAATIWSHNSPAFIWYEKGGSRMNLCFITNKATFEQVLKDYQSKLVLT